MKRACWECTGPLPAALNLTSSSAPSRGALPDAEPGLVLKAIRGGQHGLCALTPQPLSQALGCKRVCLQRDCQAVERKGQGPCGAGSGQRTPGLQLGHLRQVPIHSHSLRTPYTLSPVPGARRRGHLEGWP